VQTYLDAFNASPAAASFPNHMLYYVPPQVAFRTESADEIEEQLRRVYKTQFGLNSEEISIAECFFTHEIREFPFPDLAISRHTHHFSERKTIMDFCDYTYDNGHKGTFPLDTKPSGLLRKRAGGYDIDEDKLKWSDDDENGEDSAPEDENTEKANIKLCVRDFIKRQKLEDDRERASPAFNDYHRKAGCKYFVKGAQHCITADDQRTGYFVTNKQVLFDGKRYRLTVKLEPEPVVPLPKSPGQRKTSNPAAAQEQPQ
jgi:hypothetical protein